MIEDAIASRKLIVLMRCKSYWLDRVPELKKYDNVFELNSNQSVYLTPGNMPDGCWKKLLANI